MLESLIWCENQAIDVKGRVLCMAHAAENKVFVCPYPDNPNRLRSTYPCSDYELDSKKELGLT